MEKKICVIGCGGIAVNAHGPAYAQYKRLHSGIYFAACCDINAQRAAAFQQQFGFDKYYTDYQQMLTIEQPDAVCLLCSENATAAIAIAIIQQGIPILVEKPPGRNQAETSQMIAAAKAAEVPVCVAFNRRYMPLIRVLREQMQQEESCTMIQHIRYELFRIGRKDSDFAVTAIHGIDTVRFLADSDYESIHFQYQPLPQIGERVVNVTMQCKMVSGATAQLSFCPVSGISSESAVINAYGHTFLLELPVLGVTDAHGRIIHRHNGTLALDMRGEMLPDGIAKFEENGFYAENALFFDALRTGNPLPNNLSDSLQSVTVADCIRRRMETYRR